MSLTIGHPGCAGAAFSGRRSPNTTRHPKRCVGPDGKVDTQPNVARTANPSSAWRCLQWAAHLRCRSCLTSFSANRRPVLGDRA